MDGMLSQDEINALLNGMDLSIDETADMMEDAASAVEEVAEETVTTDDFTTVAAATSSEADQSLLTDVEKDAIGEVAYQHGFISNDTILVG